MKCPYCGFDFDKHKAFSSERLRHGWQGHYERFAYTKEENKK
jgi:hypothetical protein